MPLYKIYPPDCDNPEEIFADSPKIAALLEAEKNVMVHECNGYKVTVLDVDSGDVYMYEVQYVPGHFEAKKL